MGQCTHGCHMCAIPRYMCTRMCNVPGHTVSVSDGHAKSAQLTQVLD